MNGPRRSLPNWPRRRWPSWTIALEIEKLLLQADIKVNALQTMVWRLGATGDASLIGSIAKTQTALRNNFNELRGEADDRDLLVVISALDKIVKRFLAANDEAVKIEELKADIVTKRTSKSSRRPAN